MDEQNGMADSQELGPCGCVDYHMADCHLGNAGAGGDYMTAADYYEWYGPNGED